MTQNTLTNIRGVICIPFAFHWNCSRILLKSGTRPFTELHLLCVFKLRESWLKLCILLFVYVWRFKHHIPFSGNLQTTWQYPDQKEEAKTDRWDQKLLCPKEMCCVCKCKTEMQRDWQMGRGSRKTKSRDGRFVLMALSAVRCCKIAYLCISQGIHLKK